MAGYTTPFMLVKFRISWQMILLYFLNNLLFTRPIQLFLMVNQIRKVKRHNDCLLITPVLLVSLTVLLTM